MKHPRLHFAAAILGMVLVGLWLGGSLTQRPPLPSPSREAKAAPAPAPAPLPQPAPAVPSTPGSLPSTLDPSQVATVMPGGKTRPPERVPPRPAAPPPVQLRPAPSPGASDQATLDAATIDIQKVYLMLRDYRTLMGGNPVGTNAEIMKAIMGGNPRGAQLGPPEGMRVNSTGELVDRWGTPLFFHQMSASDMQIRSAGPDRMMWTADDVFLK